MGATDSTALNKSQSLLKLGVHMYNIPIYLAIFMKAVLISVQKEISMRGKTSMC